MDLTFDSAGRDPRVTSLPSSSFPLFQAPILFDLLPLRKSLRPVLGALNFQRQPGRKIFQRIRVETRACREQDARIAGPIFVVFE